MTSPRSRPTGRRRAAALPAATAHEAQAAAPTQGTGREPRTSGPRPDSGQVPRLILVRGPIREPLDRRANSLIASGLVGAAVGVNAALIIKLIIARPPPWLVWTVAAGCLTIAAISIAVGVAVRVGLRYAREVRRRQPPQATPSAQRPHHRVVIEGSLAGPQRPPRRRRHTDRR